MYTPNLKYNRLFKEILDKSGFMRSEMARAANTSHQNIKNSSTLKCGLGRNNFLKYTSNISNYLNKKIQELQQSINSAVLLKTHVEILKEQVEKED
jgi:hypothetical protein